MSIEPQILEVESRMNAAILAADVAILDLLIDDDALNVDPSGHFLSKSDDFKSLGSGLLKMQKFECTEMEIRDLDGVAVAISRCDLEYIYDALPQTADFRFMRIWKRKSQGWVMVAGHCNLVR